MVIFDRDDQVLKALDFKRDPAELIYQLKNGETTPDRAEAAAALGTLKGDLNAVAALGDAAQRDPFWGVRVEALQGLGRIGGADAEKEVFAGVNDSAPWVREVAVRELGNFKEDDSLPLKLSHIASADPAYRVRTAALGALAKIQARMLSKCSRKQ